MTASLPEAAGARYGDMHQREVRDCFRPGVRRDRRDSQIGRAPEAA